MYRAAKNNGWMLVLAKVEEELKKGSLVVDLNDKDYLTVSRNSKLNTSSG